jgi:hypothetical protein
MVGGIVIGLARGADSTLVHVRDDRPAGYADTCSVRVVERRRKTGEPVRIEPGDAIWWQGENALWTPAGVSHVGDAAGCGKRWDVRLPRVGYSH